MIRRLLKLSQVFHTVKYLRFEQIWFRLYYRFKKITSAQYHLANSRASWQWSGPSIYKQSIFDNNTVRFLSKDGVVISQEDWNSPQMEKLWLYNLHYFDDLNASDYLSREQIHFMFINKWIDENPACQGNGWEPYPISLRLVNWVKWFSKKETVDPQYLSSILQQACALSQQLEYHILGNHLFANAKALTFVGCFIQHEQADKFLSIGLKLLDREIPEQFLDDGAHFELSPMYHEILLWDLLELIDLANTSKNAQLQKRLPYWRQVATKALAWLKTMIHPDGEVSFFNDSAIGIAASPKQIFDYAIKLDLPVLEVLPSVVTNNESGYSRITTSLYSLIIDHANVGPDYLPGHAHADTLSFEMSVGEERVFVNTGTSLYGVSVERLRQRKTAAHNTVSVNDEDSSEVWSGFRVARRAYCKLVKVEQNKNEIYLEAEHDGYKRLPSKVVHNRRFITDETQLQIKDTLKGRPEASCAYFHLHPSVEVQAIDSKSVKLITRNKIELVLTCSSDIVVFDSTYHPGFGESIDNKALKMNLVDNHLNTMVNIIKE